MCRLTIVLSFLFLSTLTSAQIVDIPDANFKRALIDQGVDTNGDGEIQVSEAELVEKLDLRIRSISNMVGIEYFKSLKVLNAYSNDITQIDITNNINLEELDLSDNEFTEIDLTKNVNLRILEIAGNDLLELDISRNLLLQELYARNSSDILEIDVRSNALLEVLDLASWLRLKELDVSNNLLLRELNISGADLTEIDLRNNINLEKLECFNMEWDEIDISKNLKLKFLDLSRNNFSELDISDHVHLEILELKSNELNELNVDKNTVLEYLGCSINNIEEIDISNNALLRTLNISDNKLKGLNLSSNKRLSSILCRDNNLTELDLSNNSRINDVFLQNNNLSFLNIKNGRSERAVTLEGNDNLFFVCCDGEELGRMEDIISDNGFNCELNRYCSFNPGGAEYSIKGRILFDSENNKCNAGQGIPIPYFKMEISENSQSGFWYANENGNIEIKVTDGDYTISSDSGYSNLFESSPNMLSISFPDDGDTIIQDFCITPKEEIQDLEITIVPLGRARPGFDSNYKIIYENKGTTVASGEVHFFFQDNLMELVSATPMEDDNGDSHLVWNYENLLPFGSREILVTMELNRPTDNPPLNGDEIVTFKAKIDPSDNDHTTSDNQTRLSQVVVNSYDPNDKTCLEGNSVTEEMIGEYVHYMIRFENTGTAEAINVVVTDSLDTSRFDVESLEIVEASHDMKARIDDGHVAVFYFADILLPFEDATNDGYVVFKIKTLPTLQIGDSFENTAEIYFDYNFPIVTNTTSTSIDVVSSVENVLESDITVNVFPNPAQDNLTITSESPIKSLTIYTTEGRVLQQRSFVGNRSQLQVDVAGLDGGMYLIEVFTEKGSMIDKILVEN